MRDILQRWQQSITALISGCAINTVAVQRTVFVMVEFDESEGHIDGIATPLSLSLSLSLYPSRDCLRKAREAAPVPSM